MEALHCGTAGRAFLCCCCCCWTAPHCRICQPFYLQPLDFYTVESSHILRGRRLHPLSDTVAIGQGNGCGCDPYGFVLVCSMFFHLALSPTAVSSLPIIWSLRVPKVIKFWSPQRQNGPHVEAMEIGNGKGLAPRCSGHMCSPSDCHLRAPALLCVLWGKLICFSLASPLLAQRLPFPWPSSLITFALCYVFRSSLSSANTADMSLFILSIITRNRYLGYFTIAAITFERMKKKHKKLNPCIHRYFLIYLNFFLSIYIDTQN